MRRWDQPRRCSVRMLSVIAILSRFAMVRLLGQRGCPEAYRAHLGLLKMAGFHAPRGGWVSAPADILADDVVEVQPPHPGTRPDPVVLAGGDVGVERGLGGGTGEEPLPEPLPDAIPLGPLLAASLLLLPDLDLIGGGLGQGYHLLDIDQQ